MFKKIFFYGLIFSLTLGGFVPISVQAVEKPDLIITDTYFSPSNPQQNEVFSGKLIVKVKNSGSTATNYSEGIRISASMRKANDTLVNWSGLDSLKYISNLGVGETSNVELSLNNIIFDTDSVTITAWVDNAEQGSSGFIDESNENNNTFTKTIALQSLQKSDLTIKDAYIMETFISVLSRNPQPGEEFYVKPVYANIGDAKPNSNFIVAVYVDNAVVNRLEFSKDFELNTNQEADRVFGVIINTAGSHEIKVVIDPDNAIDESNENNNIYTKTVTIGSVSAKPDLIVSSINIIPTSPTVGGQVEIEIRVTNIDTSLTHAPDFTNTAFQHPDLTIEGSSNSPLPTETNPLETNDVFIFKYTGKFITPGDKEIFFRVDNANMIDESNENNNTFTKTITVIGEPVTPTPTPTPTPSTPEPTPTPTEPTPTGSVEPSKVERLILKLERTISALEQQIVEIEKRLVKVVDRALTHRVKGRILLQVEEHGEAWYVDPESENKLYMRDGQAAYDIMRALGLGITNTNLEKIPIGIQERLFELKDTDNDGIPDKVEEAIGTDKNQADSDRDGYNDKTEILNSYRPDREGKFIYDSNLANRLVGRILLQVESHGEAWYIHPSDNKRYYLGDPGTAYNVMRFLSLGITNNDLRKIQVGEFE